MDEYTYDNIIIDPTKEGIENLIGKEVYISDVPKCCLRHANKNESDYLAVLIAIRKDNVYPFLVKRKSVNYEETRSCIIVKKEPSYSERAKKWIEQNDLKEGDYVKVTRKAEIYEDGWDSLWNDSMTDYIGKALKVLAINSLRGLISLECDDAVYDFPYFVLEKAEKPKPKYVPFESIEEFLTAYFKSVVNSECIQKTISSTGIWLKHNDAFLLVVEIWDRGVVIGDINMQTTEIEEDEYLTVHEVTKWKELLEYYTFLDGSPCGKLVEESNA